MQRVKQKWYDGDSIISSIGQGMFLTTPLQIANYTALIASGKLPIPPFAKQIGNVRNENEVLSGDEIDKCSDEEFSKVVETINVFARASTAHKVRIVEALQKKWA